MRQAYCRTRIITHLRRAYICLNFYAQAMNGVGNPRRPARQVDAHTASILIFDRAPPAEWQVRNACDSHRAHARSCAPGTLRCGQRKMREAGLAPTCATDTSTFPLWSELAAASADGRVNTTQACAAPFTGTRSARRPRRWSPRSRSARRRLERPRWSRVGMLLCFRAARRHVPARHDASALVRSACFAARARTGMHRCARRCIRSLPPVVPPCENDGPIVMQFDHATLGAQPRVLGRPEVRRPHACVHETRARTYAWLGCIPVACGVYDRNSFLRASSSLSFSTRSGRETGWSGRAGRCSFSTRRGAPFYIDWRKPKPTAR